MLTVLNVAYPLAPVGPDAIGGAEQVLTALDRGLAEAGHRSLVIACEGSEIAGTLIPVPSVGGTLDDAARARAQEYHRRTIRSVLDRHPVDLVHLHGIDFHAYLPPPGVRALVTLHLPPDWYPAEALAPRRPDTWLHCVSQAQHRECPPSPALLPPIPNGVPVDRLYARHAKRNFALALGRICPEKGYPLALDAVRRAGVSLILAGQVFPYEAHQNHFRQEIAPRLDRRRRFIGPIGFDRKRRLMTAARCLLIPSQVPETSSLVAMEALACGTPVIAFPHGALSEVIEHGRTGFLVGSTAEMAEAIHAAAGIDPETCRAAARERFSQARMTARYLDLYEGLARA